MFDKWPEMLPILTDQVVECASKQQQCVHIDLYSLGSVCSTLWTENTRLRCAVLILSFIDVAFYDQLKCEFSKNNSEICKMCLDFAVSSAYFTSIIICLYICKSCNTCASVYWHQRHQKWYFLLPHFDTRCLKIVWRAQDWMARLSISSTKFNNCLSIISFYHADTQTNTLQDTGQKQNFKSCA